MSHLYDPTMRFKAEMVPEQVNLLYSLLVPLSKLSSSNAVNDGTNIWFRNGSIVTIDQTHVHVQCRAKGNDADGLICCAQLAAMDGIFLHHRIESNADDSRIVLSLDLNQLKIALQSLILEKSGNYRGSSNNAQDSRITIIKLAKRQGLACLCIEAESAGSCIQVAHAIPVRVLRPEDRPQPPVVALPDIQLQLPVDTPIRTILDQMLKSIANGTAKAAVSLTAQRSGELSVVWDAGSACIRTFLSKLVPVEAETVARQQQDENHIPNEVEQSQLLKESATVHVDLRKLATGFHWQQQLAVNAVSSVVLCMIEAEQIIIHVTLDPIEVGFFTYYIPVQYQPSMEVGQQ